MKMLPYVALVAVLCLPLAALAAPPGPTQAPMQAPKAAPAPVQAPMQAPMQAPKAAQAPMQAPTQAPMKTAEVGGGYRTYSYEPGAAGYSYGGGYSNGTYRRATGHSYQNVTNKTLGRVD
jgi:hypothetical protein